MMGLAVTTILSVTYRREVLFTAGFGYVPRASLTNGGEKSSTPSSQTYTNIPSLDFIASGSHRELIHSRILTPVVAHGDV